MSKITNFIPKIVGDNYVFKPDDVLEQAKGNDFINLLVIGEKDDGELYVAGNVGTDKSISFLERAKHLILFGENE